MVPIAFRFVPTFIRKAEHHLLFSEKLIFCSYILVFFLKNNILSYSLTLFELAMSIP